MPKLKIAFAIPHYYKYGSTDGHGYGTQRAEQRAGRVERCIRSLHETFAEPRTMAYNTFDGNDDEYRCFRPADMETRCEVDVYVCTTTGGDHLLGMMDLPEHYYTHVRTDIRDPICLGFGCHKVLQMLRGEYDYYCFLEDDNVIHDSFFFWKINWFDRTFGSRCVLQPYRYAISRDPVWSKVYPDPQFPRERWNPRWIDFARQPVLEAPYLGGTLRFIKTTNPHAAGFFLSAEKYGIMCDTPGYGTYSDNFISPLESAASLDLIRAFQVYQTDVSQASFLEMETF